MLLNIIYYINTKILIKNKFDYTWNPAKRGKPAQKRKTSLEEKKRPSDLLNL